MDLVGLLVKVQDSKSDGVPEKVQLPPARVSKFMKERMTGTVMLGLQQLAFLSQVPKFETLEIELEVLEDDEGQVS